MTNVNKLLDTAREVCGADSDSDLAGTVGVSRQLVSQWRNGANPISDDRVIQLAELAKMPPESWLLAVRAEQAHGPAAKHWRTLLQRFSAAAAVLILMGLSPADSSNVLPAEHSIADRAMLNDAQVMHYAK